MSGFYPKDVICNFYTHETAEPFSFLFCRLDARTRRDAFWLRFETRLTPKTDEDDIKTMATYTDPSPWAMAPDSLWRNNDLDPHRFALREALVKEEVRDFKIAEAIQFGRIYGLGSQHYQMIRQRKFEAVLAKRPITSKVW